MTSTICQKCPRNDSSISHRKLVAIGVLPKEDWNRQPFSEHAFLGEKGEITKSGIESVQLRNAYLYWWRFPTVKLHEIIENRKLLSILLFGLGLLILVLDALNPFTEFLRTWNIVYVLANFFAFLALMAPVFVILGFLVEADDTAALFFSCLWIPIIHYLLKGFLLLYMISEDPGLLVTMGSDIGWRLFDWRDFAVFYYGSFPIYVITVWAFSVIFMVLGAVINLQFGEGIRKIAKKVFRMGRSE